MLPVEEYNVGINGRHSEKTEKNIKTKTLQPYAWSAVYGSGNGNAVWGGYGKGFAGVLHDCAKYMEDKEILEKCDKHHISCSEAERKMPHLLHAKLGVYYARKKYGISDEQILSAIRWHTTGKPSMTALEKIIFIADYIEPGRKMVPDMEKIRRVSFLDLDEAMYLILKNTLSYLQDERMESKGFIDPYTTDAYEYYKHVHDHVIGNGGR